MSFWQRFKIAKTLRDDAQTSEAFKHAQEIARLRELEQQINTLTAQRAELKDKQKAVSLEYEVQRERVKELGRI
jgi:hypothetical protein